MIDWQEITNRTNQHPFMSAINRSRDRIISTNEWFTPTKCVIDMLSKMDIDCFAPGETVMDPFCGDGQFLVPVKWLKVLHFGMTEQDAVKDLYGVDIMRDNVDLCLRRLGGGNIVMGDTLHPDKRLDGQTEAEFNKIVEWFSDDDNNVWSCFG
jgi:hypothetical protein